MNISFPTAPNEFTLNITNLCNLDCRHCNVAATKNAKDDLTAAEWKGLIGELAEMKVFKIIVSGGEPFMRPDFLELVEYIFSHHFRLYINTNGTLIDKKTAQFLKKFKRLECVQVSIEGSTAAIHERIRPESSFDRAMSGIRALVAEGVNVATYTALNRFNCGDLENIILLGKKLGVGNAAFCEMLPVGNAREHFGELAATIEQRHTVSDAYRRLQKKYGGFIGGPLAGSEQFLDTFRRVPADAQGHTGDRFFSSCGGGFNTCEVRPDGWVIPCSRLWGYKIDNVREKCFREIWNKSGKMREFRKRRLAKVNDLLECAGCEYIPLCCGGCPAVPFEYGKGISAWDPTSCYKVYLGKKESYVTGGSSSSESAAGGRIEKPMR